MKNISPTRIPRRTCGNGAAWKNLIWAGETINAGSVLLALFHSISVTKQVRICWVGKGDGGWV